MNIRVLSNPLGPITQNLSSKPDILTRYSRKLKIFYFFYISLPPAADLLTQGLAYTA